LKPGGRLGGTYAKPNSKRVSWIRKNGGGEAKWRKKTRKKIGTEGKNRGGSPVVGAVRERPPIEGGIEKW